MTLKTEPIAPNIKIELIGYGAITSFRMKVYFDTPNLDDEEACVGPVYTEIIDDKPFDNGSVADASGRRSIRELDVLKRMVF